MGLESSLQTGHVLQKPPPRGGGDTEQRQGTGQEATEGVSVRGDGDLDYNTVISVIVSLKNCKRTEGWHDG